MSTEHLAARTQNRFEFFFNICFHFGELVANLFWIRSFLSRCCFALPCTAGAYMWFLFLRCARPSAFSRENVVHIVQNVRTHRSSRGPAFLFYIECHIVFHMKLEIVYVAFAGKSIGKRYAHRTWANVGLEQSN